jgi:hypothetical protein
LICFALLPLRAAAPLLHIPLPPTVIHAWYSTDFHNLDRARMLDQLREQPGRHLVIVRYKPDHEVLEEWVYNEADIDGSKVVWARDMGAARNQELIEYYKDRRTWLLEADENPPLLTAYWCSSCARKGAAGAREHENSPTRGGRQLNGLHHGN